MTKKNMGLLNKLLITISDVGENYGVVLMTGLMLIGSTMLYGYIFNHHELVIWSIYAALAFVFTPPAVLMSSYIISRLSGSTKLGNKIARRADD